MSQLEALITDSIFPWQYIMAVPIEIVLYLAFDRTKLSMRSPNPSAQIAKRLFAEKSKHAWEKVPD